MLSGIPPIQRLAKKTEEHLKGMVVPGTLFEELGFNYIGPVDGHDVVELVKTLKNMRELKGPQFLHIMTKKVKVTNRLKKIRLVIMACQNSTRMKHRCLKSVHRSRLSRKSLVISCVTWLQKIQN